MNQVSVVDMLRVTALEIQEHGHAKSALVDANGGMCILGAICKAVTGEARAHVIPDYLNEDSRKMIGNVIKAMTNHLETGGVHDLVVWNNNKKTTQEEIVGALIACAEIETARTSAVVDVRVPATI